MKRIFPLKETGYSLLLSIKCLGSKTGKGTVAIEPSFPNNDHNSSAICGAYGEITTARGSEQHGNGSLEQSIVDTNHKL
jgi:hypothetical protein